MKLSSIHQYNQVQKKKYAAKTGFAVDIEQLGKNTQTIAHQAKQSLEEIRKGVWLSISSLTFKDGNFTNVYDMFWQADTAELTPHIHSAKHPYYMFDFIQKDPSVLAVINGSFFFLIDNKDKEPIDFPFHFCVREGNLIGLLSSDEAVLYTKNGKMHVEELQASGTMKIGSNLISWYGSETKENKLSRSDVVLYNSGSAKILKSFDKKTGVRNGFLDNGHIHTPSSESVKDLIVKADKTGNLRIQKIKNGGGTHYFGGLFILQVSTASEFQVGDLVTPLSLDSLDLNGVTSGITINKNINNPYFYVTERINSRDARSVIAQDVAGNVHFIVFDGSKYVPKFNGVSANDIQSYFSKDRFDWAYFLDGGSSSRIVIRDGKRYRFLANDFAFRRIGLDVFKWDWKRHRKLASSIALRIKTD